MSSNGKKTFVCDYPGEMGYTSSYSDYIFRHVCSNFPERYKVEGKTYCVFHAPVKDKKDKFEIAFSAKLASNHMVFPGTFFPIPIELTYREIQIPIDFSNCIFEEEVKFDGVSFLCNTDFKLSTFRKKASFDFTTFSQGFGYQDLTIDFSSIRFESDVNFISTKFVSKVSFNHTKFVKGFPSFLNTVFLDLVDFENTVFGLPVKSDLETITEEERTYAIENNLNSSVSFGRVFFEREVSFQEAEFWCPVSFSRSTFKNTADFRVTLINSYFDFKDAKFESFVKFSPKGGFPKSWKDNGLNFSFVDIEKPHLVFFNTLLLRPDFFINTDTRKFNFTDIKWIRKNFALDWSRFKDICFWKEDARRRKSSYEELSNTYQKLATNSDENGRYSEASGFRFTAMEIQRIGSHWYGRLPLTLSWFYKWSSRYGENWLWALTVLVLIVALFSFYFSYAYFSVCPKYNLDSTICITRTLSLNEAVHQTVMTAALQNVEYRRTLTPGEDIVILLEKIAVPVQAALLLLAIRRKFMR